jgi:hypothetical protein
MSGSQLAMRFDHLEVTFPKGTLTKSFRQDVDEFYCGIFGWTSQEVTVFGGACHRLSVDAGQFIMLAESDFPMAHPVGEIGPDAGQTMFVPHLGITLDTVDDIARLQSECQAFRARDPRVRIKEFPLQTYFNPDAASQGFLVMHLLPIWFDVHSRWWKPGKEPEKLFRYWCYADSGY